MHLFQLRENNYDLRGLDHLKNKNDMLKVWNCGNYV